MTEDSGGGAEAREAAVEEKLREGGGGAWGWSLGVDPGVEPEEEARVPRWSPRPDIFHSHGRKLSRK